MYLGTLIKFSINFLLISCALGQQKVRQFGSASASASTSVSGDKTQNKIYTFWSNNDDKTEGVSVPIRAEPTTHCTCAPKQKCPGRPGGTTWYPDPGYDPRIVNGVGRSVQERIANNPPDGIVCKEGEAYCCGIPLPVSTVVSLPYNCGESFTIPVPGYISHNGQADFGQYPWMAVILSEDTGYYIGAGVLIDDRHVLTAAHKIAEVKEKMKIRLGEWDEERDIEPYPFIEIPVAKIHIHGDFNPKNLQNDIAILKLDKPLALEKYPHINAACLPNSEVDYVGQRCWASGFGADAFKDGKDSTILKEVDLPIVDGNTCEKMLGTTSLGKYYKLNMQSFLCAGGEEFKDVCSGDGGAPLVCENTKSGRFHVVGLSSWGIGCAQAGVPGVYVNLQTYLKWIEKIITAK